MGKRLDLLLHEAAHHFAKDLMLGGIEGICHLNGSV
jgi:hypothetical protein